MKLTIKCSSSDYLCLGFGSHFNAKIIGMSTLGQIKYLNDLVHNPMPLSIIPHPFLSLSDRMSFSQRLENIIFTLVEDFFINFIHYPLQVGELDGDDSSNCEIFILIKGKTLQQTFCRGGKTFVQADDEALGFACASQHPL
jgi:hypothetical protein